MPQLPEDFSLLLAYWRSKRKGRAMPRRADIDPTELPGRLWPHLMLLDVVRKGGRTRFRYRLVGSVFEEAFGRDPTGEYQDEVIPKSAIYRDYIIEIFNEVLERKRPQYTENIFVLPGQSVPTTTKRLILPLSDDGTTVNMTLNAYEYEYPDGKAHHFAEVVVTFQELVREYLDP
jgi:hypothetical protein